MTSADVSIPLTALASPHGQGVIEPHIALDPVNGRRATVVATCPSDGMGLGRSIWCWRTTDGGRSWTDGRITQPQFDGEGVANPLISYTRDGALVAVCMTLDRGHVDTMLESNRGFTRETSPGIDEVLAAWRDTGEEGPAPADVICITRSEDHGDSWSGAIVGNSVRADRPMLAIDQGESSPYRGRAYMAWWDGITSDVAFARSLDGGRTAEPASRLGRRSGFFNAELAVGPDGVVHLVWSNAFWLSPDAEDRQAARTGIFHARSVDGGATFAEPRVVGDPWWGRADRDDRARGGA